jgi:type I restriction enzyme M protein
MSSRMLDFNTFGDTLWRIANVFRDDTLKTTEYLEEFSYFFFLKLWDEREHSEEEVLGDEYIPYLPRICVFTVGPVTLMPLLRTAVLSR